MDYEDKKHIVNATECIMAAIRHLELVKPMKHDLEINGSHSQLYMARNQLTAQTLAIDKAKCPRCGEGLNLTDRMGLDNANQVKGIVYCLSEVCHWNSSESSTVEHEGVLL